MFNPIWLPKDRYPDCQKSYNTVFSNRDGFRFCVAELRRAYDFDRDIMSVAVEVSGDTRFYLYINGEHVCAGPVAEGGDYDNSAPMKKHYYTAFEQSLSGSKLELFARVYLSPNVMTDYSQGQGAFMLNANVRFANGSEERVSTDKSWLIRFCGGQKSTTELDNTIPPDEWVNAAEVKYPVEPCYAPIPKLYECYTVPLNGSELSIAAGETVSYDFTYDKIWAGYLVFNAECEGELDINADIYELANNTAHEHIITDKPLSYRSLRMQSIGGIRLTVQNKSDSAAKLTHIGQIVTHYPIESEGNFVCSDEMLNKIYAVSKHTLKICRQSLHLDSPLHQETLGCTGDYYIESLMTNFTFGDGRLTRLDIIRTADWLRQSGGFMFHTAYSLIWLQMARDYVAYTGDYALLDEIFDAAVILLDRFHGYTDENEVIQNPPNYMFIDWVPLDGFNMHHPPKCAGQTALNAFYYKALRVMSDICDIKGKEDVYAERADRLKKGFEIFFDGERGLYFDGLNGEYEPNKWLPSDNGKRYYSKHANSLAVLYDLCPDNMKKPIMEAVMNDDTLTDFQPYFLFYVQGAVDRAGLFGKYGLALLHRLDIQVNECDKGMKEGWGAFHGDYSHAWGGCAAYYLPKKLLGLEMLEAGWKRIRLNPQLFGLEYADISVPTPFGMLMCSLKKGEKPIITAPDEIEIV